MPVITENNILNMLKNNKTNGLFFLFGDEKYLVKNYTKKLENAVLPNSANSFNYEQFDEFNFSLEKIQNFIDSLPFCSEKKFLKIINLKPESLSKNELNQFKDILKNLPDYITIVISQTSEEVNLKSGVWFGLYKFFEKYGNILKLNKLSKYRLENIASDFFKEKNVNITPKNIRGLIELCPNSLSDLNTELSKMHAFSLNKEISEEDVSNIVFCSEEANVFDLTKAITEPSLLKALNKLNILVSKKEEPVFILNIISSFYLDVYRVKLASIRNKENKDLLNFFDYKNKEFKLNLAQKYANRITLKKIKEILKQIAKVDLKLKTTNLNKKILLEELLVEILQLS